MIDAAHWESLAAMQPEDVCRRSMAAYDATTGCYELPILDRRVSIDPAAGTVAWAPGEDAGAKPPGFNYWLVSVNYLLGAKKLPPAGEWVAPRSLPYGEFFFRGPHELPTKKVADAFGDDPEAFLRAGLRLGGTKNVEGDAALVLPVLPRIPMKYILWIRDEEFPARVQILFDRNTPEHLQVDAILAACWLTTAALLGKA